MQIPSFATEKNRWLALVFLALGLAIVIIDNSVLNVAIPYILRDLHTTFDGIQWVVSGYALIIATLLITVGRLGDIWGRKKVFLLGTILFAIGSFIASLSQGVWVLFFGEALIEAIGAAMMLTSSLSLLVTQFQGQERSIAFGVWGSVAGASAAIGPLLGGYLTTYHSWRWSLRINVFVAIIAIIGSVFIRESKGGETTDFDFWGMIFSGFGLFCLIFGFIEGQKYGWWAPNQTFTIGNWQWPFHTTSVIPFAFLFAALFLSIFVLIESLIEEREKNPLLRISLFTNGAFSLGLLTTGIVSLGQFGVFFVMPIYLQNVLGLTAFQTGLVFLWSSVAIIIFGPLSGIVSAKVGSKWLVSIGMFTLGVGTLLIRQTISITANGFILGPGLILLGIGVGMASAQLTNIVLSAVPVAVSGEASAANATIRQVGTSIGVAIIGVVLSSVLASQLTTNVKSDTAIPQIAKGPILSQLQSISPESGRVSAETNIKIPNVSNAITHDVHNALVTASKNSLTYATIFIFAGAVCSLLLPNKKVQEVSEPQTSEKKPVSQPEKSQDVVWRREHALM